jgi:hypothetical protein
VPSYLRHASAYVSTREHTSAHVGVEHSAIVLEDAEAVVDAEAREECCKAQESRARRPGTVSIRQHSSAYVSIFRRKGAGRVVRRTVDYSGDIEALLRRYSGFFYTSAYVCIRQHTSAYVSIPAPVGGVRHARGAEALLLVVVPELHVPRDISEAS